MDIGVGIKNSILVLLIILILHVILKNREHYTCAGPKMLAPLASKNELVVTANCDLKQDKKNMMIINEYEDDKIKEGDVPAFDDYDINYEYYLQAETCEDKGGFGDFMSA
jgi:hypothetical protein